MQQHAESVASASEKFTLPVAAWVAHYLHVALPDIVLLVTALYTLLQITVLVRQHWFKKQIKDDDNGS